MNDDPDRSEEVELESVAEERPLVPWEPWSATDLRLQLFGQEPHLPAALLSTDCILDVLGHGRAQPEREVGGILLGSFAETSRGAATRVQDMHIADSNDASLTHVTFTHAAWEGIHAALDQRDDDLAIVGWYHTHPGFGPFLSAHDRFIHEHFFAHPLQIALVVDPLQGLLSLFGWSESKVGRHSGCWIYADQAQSEELKRVSQDLSYVMDPVPPDEGFLRKLLNCLSRRYNVRG